MQPERLHLEPGGDPRALAHEIRGLPFAPPEIGAEVGRILAEVYRRRDDAVLQLTRRFDSPAAPDELRVPAGEPDRALAELDRDLRAALELAHDNIRRVCEAEPSGAASVTLAQGQRVDLRELPVRRAAAYVPGGRHPYPSSALMSCVPARVAGVESVVVVTPPRRDEGRPDPVVLAACALCGVDEIYAIGGAQAIGALAFGTESIAPVDLIVGPGSYYVQEAKRQVVGVVGIDGVAGPSELAVVADATADPDLVALDLAAQSEHGSESLLVLITPHEPLLEAVEAGVKRIAERHDTVSDAPLALVAAPSMEDAVALANALAPEHLELVCEDAERLAGRVTAAGCVFVGATGATAFGDYVAGSNHVLPTGGAARYAGPLGAHLFRRRQALVSLPERAAHELARHAGDIARAEGFLVHAESVRARDV